ncbi:MAG: outer membrane beta-barrel protein [Bacteroidia bacterium]
MNHIFNPSLPVKLFTCLLMLIGITTNTQAQEVKSPQPKFWYGASAAANFNFYTGTTQTLNAEVKAPAAFHKGFGVGPYASALFEYRPKPMFGFMFNLAYDARGATFKDAVAPCDCEETLKTNISYLSFEPSFRYAPFSNGLYTFIGLAYSVNIGNSFTYTQEKKADEEGKMSDMRGMFSTQIGAGYDIPVSKPGAPTVIEVSPFVSYHPYFGQDPRSVESMSLTTLRIGAALKFGCNPAKAADKKKS